MQEIMLAVMAAILGSEGSKFEVKDVEVKDLPIECRAELEHAYVKNRTRWTKVDLDLDGNDELIIYNGSCGSGGLGWFVFTKKGNKYENVGSVFGGLKILDFKTYKSLLVPMACGWSGASWVNYVLKDGKLKMNLNVGVNYSEAIRQKPYQFTFDSMEITEAHKLMNNAQTKGNKAEPEKYISHFNEDIALEDLNNFKEFVRMENECSDEDFEEEEIEIEKEENK